jgi:hypothetical protein
VGSTPTLSAGPRSTSTDVDTSMSADNVRVASASRAEASLDRVSVELPMRRASGRSLSRHLIGEVTERPKVHDWKSCVSERVPRVRIPPSPRVASAWRAGEPRAGTPAPRLTPLAVSGRHRERPGSSRPTEGRVARTGRAPRDSHRAKLQCASRVPAGRSVAAAARPETSAASFWRAKRPRACADRAPRTPRSCGYTQHLRCVRRALDRVAREHRAKLLSSRIDRENVPGRR